ncbi:MAG: 50S ribosomal protein L22 [Candidatus Jorgensenbacteria bacterium]|nr:50S ribosomal protein L22 [Candidatus Jorgensenbacteria bacterium]
MPTEAKAQLRYLHHTPRKTRAVVDVIRGLSVAEAEAQLLLIPRKAATPLLKLLRSASANARAVLKQEPSTLFIKEIRVDQGPKSTRWMPRARGAMSPIEKKTSHVTIVLGVMEHQVPSRFVVNRPTKKQREDTKKEKAHAHAHAHGEKKPEPEKKEQEREESKEKGRAGVRGFMKRVFRRKAI